MFGTMNVMEVLDLQNAPADVANSSEGAVARLLDLTGHPKIEKWVQFPKAVFVFLVVAGDTESGAFYVYDRRAQVWYWVDLRTRSLVDTPSAISIGWSEIAGSWTSLSVLRY